MALFQLSLVSLGSCCTVSRRGSAAQPARHGVDQMASRNAIARSRSPSEFSAIIARMKSLYRIPILLATFVVGVTYMGQAVRAQAAAPSDDAQELVKEGQKLNYEGKQDEALKLYKQALEKSPNSYEAHLEAGVALDLAGDYAAAREHL